MRTLLLFLFLTAPLFAQEEITVDDPQLSRAWQRWDQFEADDHALMADSIEAYILAGDHPRLRTLATLHEQAPKPLRGTSWPAFDAKKYAPALKLRTREVDPEASKWKGLARHMGFDADALMQPRWHWSAGRQALLAPAEEGSSARARIESHLAGKLPTPSRWVALVESALPLPADLQRADAYFEHRYRDRDGYLYEHVRLADMWAAQREFGISDVEAVAFLREILDDDSIKSPIPGRLHNGIYALIKDQFADWREARQLRRALAAVYVGADEEVPVVLRSVAPRLELAWLAVDHDPQRMATWLTRESTRQKFLGSVEAAIEQLRKEREVADEALILEAQAWRAHLPFRAREGMRREGLMGLRRS